MYRVQSHGERKASVHLRLQVSAERFISLREYSSEKVKVERTVKEKVRGWCMNQKVRSGNGGDGKVGNSEGCVD